MSELTQRELDGMKNGRAYYTTRKLRETLVDAAETLLAIDWLTGLFCGDCPRVDECECDSEEPNCAHWAIHHREELLKLYREAQHGKS